LSQTLKNRIDLGEGWKAQLEKEFEQPYMEQLAHFLKAERHSGPVYPPAHLVFEAFRRTPFEQVKVVIVGQDPYHGPGQAEGLCFSVPHGVPAPPSLKNIFKELEADLGIQPPGHGSLHRWAEQGVLLLNTVLTVRQGEAASHRGKGWEQFTDAALRPLLGRDVVFVLWGRAARDKVEGLGGHPKVLTAPHPSPLSAYSGFFGCRHFSKVNDQLQQMGLPTIDWKL
jgi:uracil-DNA glycosylase